MRHQNGFTLIEMLISLSLVVLLCPIVIKLIQFQVNFPDRNTLRQNQIGILQLRRYLSLGIEHEINDDRVCMVYRDEDFCFYLNESSLIVTPGTQFFLIGLESVRFFVQDHWLMVEYRSMNRVHLQHMIYNEKF